MIANTVVAVLLLAPAASSSHSIPSFAGPFILYLNKFVSCEANDTDWRERYGNLKATPFNPFKPLEPQNLTGYFYSLFDIDDRIPMGLVVHKRANNQWKKNYFVFSNLPVGFCSALRSNMPDFFRVLFKPKSMTGRCIITKGKHYVDHEPVSWRLPNLPTLPYGTYLNRMTIGREGGKSFLAICAESTVTMKSGY